MEKELPKNWVNCNLSDIFEIVTGNTPSKIHSEYYGNEIPWVKPGDINKSIEIFDTEEYLSKEGFKKSRKIPIGSVMVTCIGNLGNTAIAGVELATNQQINSIVISHDSINKKYVYYYSKIIKPWLIENSTSTTIAMVNKSNFEKCPFILPPFIEQNRIVEKLDYLFGQLELIKTSMEKIPVLLKNFRQQVITRAITGQLTEEWRNGRKLKDIDATITNIKKRRRLNASPAILKKIDEIYLDKSKSIQYNNIPNEWREINLDQVCEKFTYGTSTKSDEVGDYVVLRMGNLQNGRIDWKDLKFTSDETEYEKYKLEKGDILFNRTNSPDLVGKTSIFEGEKNSIYAGYLIKIWNFGELNSYYLNYVMNSIFVKKWCLEVKSDGVSQSNINAQKLGKLTIPFTSIEEQQEIISCVESLFTKANIIEEKYKNLKTKIETLPQTILHKAFKGELSEQLDEDGNAKDLLDEIMSLRGNKMKKVKS